MGTLVLTHTRLFLVPNNEKATVVELCRLSDVKRIVKFQYKVIIPPGVPALRIITHSASPPTPTKASSGGSGGKQSLRRAKPSKSTFKNRDGSTTPGLEQTLLFWSERNSWFDYLNEMTEAHKVVGETPNAINQAAKNIELAEVVYKIAMLHQGADLMSSKSLSPKASRKLSTRFDSSSQIGRLLPFSNPVQPKRVGSENQRYKVVNRIAIVPEKVRHNPPFRMTNIVV